MNLQAPLGPALGPSVHSGPELGTWDMLSGLCLPYCYLPLGSQFSHLISTSMTAEGITASSNVKVFWKLLGQNVK